MNYYKFLSLALIVFTIASCSTNSPDNKKGTIAKLEKEFYSSEMFNSEKGVEIVNLYNEFVSEYPDDSIAGSYLYKAAEISMNLQLGKQAINYYGRVINEYPNFHKVPECLFLKAFVYENQLKDIKSAGELYSKFIAEYPNHALAKDAKASIKFLGKSPEELVKIFQEMNNDSTLSE